MTRARMAGVLALLAAIAAVGVFGQKGGPGDLRVVSSFVPAGQPVPRECEDEAMVFGQVMARLPKAGAWHWVVVCDESGWRRFLQLSGRTGEAGVYASTDLAAGTTYLRGAKLLHPDDFRAAPEPVIAHELAHILLTDADDEKAGTLGRCWEKDRIRSARGMAIPGCGRRKAENCSILDLRSTEKQILLSKFGRKEVDGEQ